MQFKITVIAINWSEDLHPADLQVPGQYLFDADTADQALDHFHSAIPIKILEDYEIFVDPATEGRRPEHNGQDNEL